VVKVLQRIEFETEDRDEAVEAMAVLAGGPITVAGTHDITLRQSVVVSDAVVDGWMVLGSGYSAVNTPGDLIHVLSTEGGWRVDTGRVRHVSGAGELVRPPTHIEASFDVPAGLMYATGISAPLVHRIAREIFLDEPADLDLDAVSPVSPVLAAHWRAFMTFYRSQILREEVQAHELLCTEATRNLAVATLVTFGLHRPRELRAAPAAAARRARAYIDQHLHEPVVAADIAAAARLSPRGLQAAFQREYGTTPMAQLRDARLSAARQDLLDGDPTNGATVAEIARRWGFAHLGRFARAYRDAYGETPAQTLRR
jgi:AraC-like DNA-binding protein